MNKYRINTNWSVMGDVIVSFNDELNRSLEVSIMGESKSEKEVRKTLNNSKGITIEELQVINVWNLPKELRIEVRNKLDWAYRYLSRETARLIGDRNKLPEMKKSVDKSKEIDSKNKELKDTIIRQYGVIESLVKSYEVKEELNEEERKKLTYIRKVYLPVLSEIIENLFSTAPKGTARDQIFPLEERDKTFLEIDNLKKKIRFLTLTKKSKQDQPKQKIQDLQQQITDLQQQLIPLKTTINKLPGLINEKGEVNEELLTLLTNVSVASEKLRLEKLENKTEEEKEIIIPTKEDFYEFFKELEDDETDSENDSDEEYRDRERWLKIELSEEKRKSDELRKKLASLKAEEESRKKQLKQQEEKEQQLKDEIESELALISRSITFPSKLSVKELNKFLTRLQEIKKSLNNNEKLEKILQETKREIKLELKKRDTKQAIADSLADKWAAPEKQTPIKKEELSKPEYRNYSETIDEMKTLNEIAVFRTMINKSIAKHRNEIQAINEGLSLGKKALNYKDVELAKKTLQYLLLFHELQWEKREDFKDYAILLKRWNEFHTLKFELIVFIEQEEAKKEQEELTARMIQLSK